MLHDQKVTLTAVGSSFATAIIQSRLVAKSILDVCYLYSKVLSKHFMDW